MMTAFNHKKILAGDRRSLAKAITIIESKLEKDRAQSQKILKKILPKTGKSIRIGVTGIPGVGKSTFIESFGLHLIEQGKKVAVLAVDPSSPVKGGSLLGDKTRMEELSQKNEAFIRPSPSSGALGGVALKTRETMLLCESAGHDVILVETVGVGQSEVEVASMVDFFLVLMLPNAGDELQGIKKGILELADAIVVNKADGDSINMAELTKGHYANAMHLLPSRSSFWNPSVSTCSATEGKNIVDIWEMIQDFETKAKKCKEFTSKRANQNQEWMYRLIHEMQELALWQNENVQRILPKMKDKVVAGKVTPYSAAKAIFDALAK